MTTVAPVSDLKHTETELLSFLCQYSVEKGVPFAFWRLPNAQLKHVILSEAAQEIDPSQMLEELDPGFLMAPFDKSKPRFFLPADLLFSFENGALKTDDNAKEISSLVWLAENILSRTPGKTVRFNACSENHSSEQSDFFKDLIASCIQEINHGTFEKIVPSRTKYINLPEDFDIVQAFQKLCETYATALISFVSIPSVGHWLGASPEVLVSIKNKAIFKTVALAGTLPYHEGLNLKSVAWTQKEIEEQALVERYVISCFKKIRLREYEEHGPKTVIAGNLMHLKSEFTVDIKATNFPQIGSVMLGLLHPTSAVCGTPLESSLAFLRQHEGYDRGFYSGYLGPVNVRNNVDLFVNIRCMQLEAHRAILYAGAGVTIDSIPQDEWAETEIKFNTLLNVIL
ncbi:MAG: chorismate-binding protein [Cyclobacteriaceae bacterium]